MQRLTISTFSRTVCRRMVLCRRGLVHYLLLYRVLRPLLLGLMVLKMLQATLVMLLIPTYRAVGYTTPMAVYLTRWHMVIPSMLIPVAIL